ncbi:hypothetical protein L9F63_010517 [Diploptera punctata]|uniref:PIN domain-containing protein n=1 Tax=Diploptera punctata TaxID=6984 RepID=A0AAD8ER47_DIPPU|nr:hypothetical protein L9F63_010517 [Diploptera punctata]
MLYHGECSKRKCEHSSSSARKPAGIVTLPHKIIKNSDRKGIAEDRLKTLQKTLVKNHENINSSLEKDGLVKPSVLGLQKGNSSSLREINKKTYKTGDGLMSHFDINQNTPSFKLKDSLLSVGSCSSQNKTVFGSKPTSSGNVVLDLTQNDDFDEAMEWEPIEEEVILFHIQEVRNEILQEGGTVRDASLSAGRKFQESILGSKAEEWFIVIDTNIFISNLSYVQELINIDVKGLGRPILVIPWQVLQELDVIKDRKTNSSLAYLARKAVNFIHTTLKMKHPHLIGQTVTDAIPKNYNKDGVPDDSILQCCLQMVKKENLVILLSNDKNLCNKAMVNGIKAFQKSELKGALRELSLENMNKKKVTFLPGNGTDSLKVTEQQENLNCGRLADSEILCKLKKILEDLFGKILKNEMYEMFGNVWTKIIKYKPPWTILDICNCFIIHWIAVFSFILPKESKSSFEILKGFFLNTQKGCEYTHSELEKMIEISLSICSTIPSKDYGNILSESVINLKNLKSFCKGTKVSKENKQENTSIRGQNQDIKVIFTALEEFYNFTIIFCGVMCELLGMEHHLVFSRPEPFPSLDQIREKLPDLHPRVNSLVRSISSIREVPPNILSLEHGAIKQLFFTLKNYLPNNDEVTPELVLKFCLADNIRDSLIIVQTKFEEVEAFLNRGTSFLMQDSA